jgi:hypothetical protein
MLPRLDAITVTPVNGVDRVNASEAVADPRQQALSRSLQTMLGKTMQAEVLSRLNDGSVVVRVNGNAARMQLPAGVQVGTEVPLKLVLLEPRPTFEYGGGAGRTAATAYAESAPAAQGARTAPAPAVLNQQAHPEPGAPAGRAGPTAPPLAQALAQTLAQTLASTGPGSPALRATSYAATLLSKAPLTPSAQLPPFDTDGEPPALSQAARTITSVLSQAMQTPSQAATIIAKTPLMAAPGDAPIVPEKLAAALQQSVGNSGLFYESHLGEWSAGARALGSLQREPQMQGLLAAAPPRPGQGEAVLDPATAQFIHQQLSAQEQGRISWQGQLWTGQPLRWEISRDHPRGNAGHDDGEGPAAPWRSGMRLRFPLLGEIGATLVLAGEQLHIEIESGAEGDKAEAVRELLRAHAPKLDAALAAAGAPLASLTVRAAAGKTDA